MQELVMLSRAFDNQADQRLNIDAPGQGGAGDVAVSPRGDRDGAMSCTICGSAMRPEAISEVFHCRRCGFFASRLPVRINRLASIDEASRERGLRRLRLANFSAILDRCRHILPDGATILDVGCAHGWFLEAAISRGYNALGVEPDTAMAAKARASGAKVYHGLFPAAVPTNARFAAITFNDVLEHLPDPDAVIAEVRERLGEGGIVVINLPVSEGIIFRLSRVAAKFGYKTPLARMWQVGLPSPHLTYFSSAVLEKLLSRHGFELVESHRLEAISLAGLWNRIRADQQMPWVSSSLILCAAIGLKLSMRWLPSDIRYFIFRKQDAAAASSASDRSE